MIKINDISRNLKHVTHFILAINMKLYQIESEHNASLMMHNSKLHVMYPIHILGDAEAFPKNAHQGFISFPNVPEGYRRGCNYSLHGNLMVLHTMR